MIFHLFATWKHQFSLNKKNLCVFAFILVATQCLNLLPRWKKYFPFEILYKIRFKDKQIYDYSKYHIGKLDKCHYCFIVQAYNIKDKLFIITGVQYNQHFKKELIVQKLVWQILCRECPIWRMLFLFMIHCFHNGSWVLFHNV